MKNEITVDISEIEPQIRWNVIGNSNKRLDVYRIVRGGYFADVFFINNITNTTIAYWEYSIMNVN